jgi:hypothetical protein
VVAKAADATFFIIFLLEFSWFIKRFVFVFIGINEVKINEIIFWYKRGPASGQKSLKYGYKTIREASQAEIGKLLVTLVSILIK